MEVKRTPIREALQRLQHIGFVEVHPRRGAVVAGVDVVRQLELIEVRRPLEELMVRCAAQRAAPDHVLVRLGIAIGDPLLAGRTFAGEIVVRAAAPRRVHVKQPEW